MASSDDGGPDSGVDSTSALVELSRRVASLLQDPATARLEHALATLPPALAGSAPANALRAEAMRRRGEATRAAALFDEAIAGAPDLDAVYHCAALARAAAAAPAGARGLWAALLARSPHDPVARYQIGLSWHDERRYDEAARWYADQLARHPASFRAAHNLGLARLAQGDATGAAAALARATELEPRHAGAWTSLGEALRRSGDHAGAARAWLRAHAQDPANVRLLARAAHALGDAAELPAAIEVLTRAIAQDPASAQLRWAAGAHLSSLGEHVGALRVMREALDRDPGDARGHSALLLELQYDTALATRDAVAAEHRRWATTHTAPLPRMRPPERTATRPRGRRLSIGYVSPRFCNGPLASLFLPVLEAHDRQRFHVTLYSTHPHADDVATRMRAACDAWRDLPADDDAAAATIAADGLDLLVDLAGHAPGHRLRVLARKPAPVIATWLDYGDTTGVDAVDYLLTDAVHTPAADIAFFSERVVWLPRCRFVYAPIVPREPATPARTGDAVKFGSLNRHAKITPAALATWTRVLEAVPGSRLELRASAYRGPGTVAWIRERWARAGVPVDRVDFLPYAPLAEALNAYRTIDVALDTFPYNGGVTTCDALAAGVPVVALAGERMIARQSAALLHAAMHPEWIAATPADYVRIAVDLARDPARAARREDVARGVARSPLCLVPAFVAGLERAYRTMIDLGARAGAAPPLEIDG